MKNTDVSFWEFLATKAFMTLAQRSKAYCRSKVWQLVPPAWRPLPLELQLVAHRELQPMRVQVLEAQLRMVAAAATYAKRARNAILQDVETRKTLRTAYERGALPHVEMSLEDVRAEVIRSYTDTIDTIDFDFDSLH